MRSTARVQSLFTCGRGFREGERKEERGSFVDFAFRPDLAAMQMNRPLHHGQSQAAPLEFLFVMQPLKDREEAVGVLGIKARSVIAHAIDSLPAFDAPGDGDGGLGLGSGRASARCGA